MQLRRIPATMISLDVVTSSGAIYASGDQIGVVMKVTNAVQDSTGISFLRSISLVDKAKQSVAVDVLFFSDLPVNVVADNAAADISDAEMAAKFIGAVSLVAGDYVAMANSSAATKAGLGLMLKASAARSKDIYVMLVARATPTYGSVQDLTLKLSFEQC